MILVNMHVSPRPYKITGLQVALLSDHVREQCVTGNVERQPQKGITRSLIKLAGEFTLRNIELEQGTARWKRHPGNVCRIPGRKHVPPGIGFTPDLFYQVADLIDLNAIPPRPASPLIPVDGT